jgi:hypothetical protein
LIDGNPSVSLDISTAAVRFVLGLCEQPEPVVQGGERTGAQCIAEAVEHGLLERLGNADWVTCGACYDDHDAPVEFDSTTKRYAHFCAEAGYVQVEVERLHRFGVNFPRLIDILREAFDMRNRPGARCLIDDILWDLGDVLVADARQTLLFARRLSFSANLISVREALARRPPRAAGLCFHTSSQTLAVDMLPGRHRVFPIFEFVSENTAFTINESSLAAALFGRPADTEFVQCSDDGSWIRIGERPYSFGGVHQMAIVRAAFEAWQSGSPRIRTQPLLEEIGCRSKQVSQVFGSADDGWRDVIGYGGGSIWLKVPE